MPVNKLCFFARMTLVCCLPVLLFVACRPGDQTLTPTPTTRAIAPPTSTPTSPASSVTCPATPRHSPIDIPSLTGRIVFSTTEDIYVMNANCSKLTRLTTKPGPEFDPSWSPDGKKIAYRDSRTGINQNDEIYVMNADGSGQHNLTNHLAGDWGPAWSPDGAKIAFNSTRQDDLPSIYVMNADGSGVKRLTAIEGEYPAWSPDGKRIAFMSGQPGASGNNPDYDIYVINVDGSGQKQLTAAPGEDGWPAWSPDGTKIAFATARDDKGQTGDIGPFFDIWVMNADGSGQTRLTQGFGQFVAWSPDGTKLVVSGDCGGYGLCVTNADGSRATQLISGELLLPDWIA